MELKDYIDYLQRFIIVHSFIYYELDRNVISDRQYDATCKKLVALKEMHPELWRNSEYFKQFGAEYTGATGFTLYHDLNDNQKEIIQSIAYTIAPVRVEKRKKK